MDIKKEHKNVNNEIVSVSLLNCYSTVTERELLWTNLLQLDGPKSTDGTVTKYGMYLCIHFEFGIR